jgi:hypothetical protein
MDPVAIVVVAAVGLLYIAAISYAVVLVTRTRILNDVEKLVWVAAVILFPVVGSIVWFAAGPHPFGLRLGNSVS